MSEKRDTGGRRLLIGRLLFVLLVTLCLFAGFLKTVLAPAEINYYENRPAARAEAPSLSGFLDSGFQDSLEAALSDQIFGAPLLKKAYNDVSSALLLGPLRRMTARHPDRFFRYRTVLLNRDAILWQPLDLARHLPDFTAAAQGYGRVFAADPQLDVFFFFIETDSLIDFATGEELPLYDCVRELMGLPEDHCARFMPEDYEQYRELFYRTDHHWNNRGSYRAYCEILRLLGCPDAPLQPLGEYTLGPMTGSKAEQAGLTEMSEMVTVYRFAYPPLGTNYGHEDEMLSRPAGSGFSYGTFYGGDAGLIVFDTGDERREDLLVIGDSYDNAILKLLASHCRRTWAVDLRNYESEVGEAFRFGAFVREHGVDRVLLVGSHPVFGSEYILED